MKVYRTGIYKIVNKMDGYFYIGSTSNFHKRWLDHQNYLNKNKHDNRRLQTAWNQYKKLCIDSVPSELFDFRPIIYCDKEQLFFYEQRFLDKYYGLVECYNLNKMADRPCGMAGRKHKKESKDKISRAKTGKCIGTNNPFFGKYHTQETKRKLSESKLGKPVNLSDDGRNRLSVRMRGSSHPMSKLIEQDILDIREALKRGARNVDIAKQYNIKPDSVYEIKSRRTWKHI